MAKIQTEYNCAILLANDLIGGKWKLRILWHIIEGHNRFSLLQKNIQGISHKVLISQLKELEASGLIVKRDFNTQPPRIEYAISDKHKDIILLIKEIDHYTINYAKKENITLPY